MKFKAWFPQLFEGWITLNRYPWVSGNKTNHALRWIVIYPVVSFSHLSNNPDLIFSHRNKMHTIIKQVRGK